MDAEALQKRAQHLRKLAEFVADERTRQAALRMADDCDHQVDALEHGDHKSLVPSAHSSSPVQSAAKSGPFAEIGDEPGTAPDARHKHFMASSPPIRPSADIPAHALATADMIQTRSGSASAGDFVRRIVALKQNAER